MQRAGALFGGECSRDQDQVETATDAALDTSGCTFLFVSVLLSPVASANCRGPDLVDWNWIPSPRFLLGLTVSVFSIRETRSVSDGTVLMDVLHRNSGAACLLLF